MAVETAVRGALIVYGVAAFTWLFAKTSPATDAGAATPLRSLLGMVVVGLALQVLWWLVRRLLARAEPDPDAAVVLTAQARYIFEIIVDGVTVLLFALATFGALSGTLKSF